MPELRTVPHPGLAQLGLVRTKGLSSWLTRVVTRSAFNHIILYEAGGRVISCQPSGVTEMTLENFPSAVWSDFDLTLQQRATIINFARKQLGKPYDQFMYVWCGIARIFGVKNTPKWILRRLASKKAWICSQLTDSAYRAANIHLFTDHRAEGEVVPGDYVPIWEEHGWMK